MIALQQQHGTLQAVLPGHFVREIAPGACQYRSRFRGEPGQPRETDEQHTQADHGACDPDVQQRQSEISAAPRPTTVGRHARIGRDVRILNEARREHHDGEGYFIRDGIVVVPKNAVVPDGAVI